MIKIEAHDQDFDDERGTLCFRTRKGVDYTYQVELHVGEMVEGYNHLIRRLFVFDGETVHVVYAYDEYGRLSYVGRHPQWDGHWILPFFHSPGDSIAVAVVGKDVKDFNEATQWSDRVLQGSVVIAVLMDDQGVVAAWERGTDKSALVSRAQRATLTT